MKKDLQGFGVGLKSAHYRWITENLPNLEWVEVHTEDFLASGGQYKKFLKKLRENYAIAFHEVGLSIASIESIDFDYLRKLKDLVSWLEPSIVSDHLSWTRQGGINSHILLPFPYNEITLNHIIQKVDQIQDYLNRQIVLENTAFYASYLENEMTEAEFLAEVSKKTGCGILLDINNIYLNLKNLGWSPEDTISVLPFKALKQIHFNIVDETQSEEMWGIFQKVVHRWPNSPISMQWRESLSDFQTLQDSILMAKNYHSQTISRPSQLHFHFEMSHKIKAQRFMDDDLQGSPLQSDQKEMLRWIMEGSGFIPSSGDLARFNHRVPLAPKKGLLLYQEAYFSRLREVLLGQFPALAWVIGRDGFDFLIKHYLKKFPPSKDLVQAVGENLSHFLRTTPLDWSWGFPQDLLVDLSKFEWANSVIFNADEPTSPLEMSAFQNISHENLGKVRFGFSEATHLLEFQWDIGPFWEATRKGEISAPPQPLKSIYLLYRKNLNVQFRRLSFEEAVLLKEMLDGYSLAQACSVLLKSQDDKEIRKVISKSKNFLEKWISDQMVVRLMIWGQL